MSVRHQSYITIKDKDDAELFDTIMTQKMVSTRIKAGFERWPEDR